MHPPRLLLTIDVEEDMPGWNIIDPIATTNASALPGLQVLCNELGVRTTYLCDYPMVTEPRSAAILRALAQNPNCEIGAHLHPWNTPPYAGIPGSHVDEKTVAYYMYQLGAERFRAKLETLTNAIVAGTGVRPRSFRAGRFGIDGETLQVVAELGYTVDSSVTPLAEHLRDGGPDFRSAPQFPYRPNAKNVCIPGDLPIVEIPVSIGLTRSVPRFAADIYVYIPKRTRIRGLLSKDYLNIIDFAWLYPVRFDLPEMRRAARNLAAAGSPVLNVFMHSSELTPATSGSVHSESDVRRTLERLRGILTYCIEELKAVPATLGEAGAGIARSPEFARR
ncbi:MAG: polysaccharide deacetylase family protein [Planctomycetes bacterium]|nr:polysaccharide deacetylase family protein [Planctomycetota bacterium]